MAERAITTKCRCGNQIWLSLAGWVHVLSDTRTCIKLSRDKSTWELLEGRWAQPRLTQDEAIVLGCLVGWTWFSDKDIALRTARNTRSARATLVGLRRKRLVETKAVGRHGELVYRRCPA